MTIWLAKRLAKHIDTSFFSVFGCSFNENILRITAGRIDTYVSISTTLILNRQNLLRLDWWCLYNMIFVSTKTIYNRRIRIRWDPIATAPGHFLTARSIQSATEYCYFEQSSSEQLPLYDLTRALKIPLLSGRTIYQAGNGNASSGCELWTRAFEPLWGHTGWSDWSPIPPGNIADPERHLRRAVPNGSYHSWSLVFIRVTSPGLFT